MKVAVLVSGGVDSSVALAMLKQQGYDVTAFYLKIWLEDELAYLGDCPWQDDLHYVRAVCDQLAVDLQIVSLQKEYWDHVVTYTIAQAKAGLTPNPDILCNSRIKFGFFLDTIDALYEKVATGHYAQASIIDGKAHLLCSPDPVKDQTYFLSHLTQAQLMRALFPIGHLDKGQVRAYAHQMQLPTKDRKDSQGICFLGKLRFRDFLKHYLGEKTGNIVEFETGNVLGAHAGYWFYTIGQRQGLGLSHGPWYVVAKDMSKNIIYISRNYHADDKKRDFLTLGNCNWIGSMPSDKMNLQLKLRHGAQRYDCTLKFNHDSTIDVQLPVNDQGIAPGQFAVFYDKQQCLGGGLIMQSRV